MREIKFRVWSKGRLKMFEVDGINTNFIYAKISNLVNINLLRKDVELMQYTGLKDKNGREIYEGDIYHQGDKNILYVVVWKDTSLIGKQARANSYAGLKHWKDRIEVIGNIYENPELLGVQNAE